jgi:hypothetical protein
VVFISNAGRQVNPKLIRLANDDTTMSGKPDGSGFDPFADRAAVAIAIGIEPEKRSTATVARILGSSPIAIDPSAG